MVARDWRNAAKPAAVDPMEEKRKTASNEEVRMLRVFSVLALASGLALATGPPAVAEVMSQGMPSQGMPMGGMKTTKDLKDLDDQKKKAAKPEEAPNQAQAPKPERVTPTYRDTTEDRIMREKTDDGAHDRNDTQM